jgi:predicted alpha/beta-fold hydrolase
MRRRFLPSRRTGASSRRPTILSNLPFNPLTGLGNPHLQTVLGNLWPGRAPPLQSTVRVVPLPDGDQLLVYDSVPRGWAPGDWAALQVHGLGGSHESGTMRRLAAALCASGFRVLRMNLRAAGPSIALCRRLYHGGCSDDVRVVAEHAQLWTSGSPLVLAGFSLGGNIVLKLAGEAASAPLTGLVGVAAISAPIDMVLCCALLGAPHNRFYDRHYTRALVSQVRRHERLFPDQPRVDFPAGVTLRQFDDLFTAPRWGFADALDYYRRASALPWVARIAVPAYLVTARDDPFIAVTPFEELPANPLHEIHIADHGGHLGFLGADGAGGVRWAERRVVEWINQLRQLTP